MHFDNALLKKGIRADISMEEKKIDAPFGVDYYLWLPTKDHYPPTKKQLKVGVAFIKELVKNKIKCYVHCKQGHGRSVTLVAAYLIDKGMSIDETLSFIKKRRPAIHPNKRQIEALK